MQLCENILPQKIIKVCWI